MTRFNLIVTTNRFWEEDGENEILDLLEVFGDHEAESEIIGIRGIILAETSLDPFVVIEKLKEMVALEPWQIRYVLRVLPVQVVVPTTIYAISKAARDLSSRIGNETFRVTVEKRHNSLCSMEVVEAVASQIQNKVDLENPCWVLLVQILGGLTGISVLRPNQIFSSVVEKRK